MSRAAGFAVCLLLPAVVAGCVLPYAVPSVIASLLWGFLYLPAVSPLHYLFDKLGLTYPDLLGPDGIMGSVANIGIWGGVGFNMLVLFTALRAIPRELHESARMDGCSEMQIAWHVKLPHIVPALIMTTIFSTIATLQVFSEPTTVLEYFRMTVAPALPDLKREGRIEVHVLEKSDHTFSGSPQQARVLELASNWLLDSGLLRPTPNLELSSLRR